MVSRKCVICGSHQNNKMKLFRKITINNKEEMEYEIIYCNQLSNVDSNPKKIKLLDLPDEIDNKKVKVIEKIDSNGKSTFDKI
jgi:hypothetical protein